jgi:hypothetical protein
MPTEEKMRKITLILAGLGCIGLAAPSFAAVTAPDGAPIASSSPCQTESSDKSSQKKKKSKKSSTKKETTGRSSWGG